MSALRTGTLILLLAELAGCAAGTGLLPVPSPAEIPWLEAARAGDPGDLATGVRLATAYREAGRAEDARNLVALLTIDAPTDPGLLVLTGLLAEDTAEWAAARVAYETLIAEHPSGALRDQVERRLEIVRAQELRADVLDALAREADLAQTSPDPRTVGIFPFVYEGDDPTWEPLELALPDLLATDLAVTGRLTVLERIRVRTLITELALGASGRVDPATAARSGRLLGSGHVVQGRYRIGDATRINIDLAVVEVLQPGAEEVAPVTAEDVMERFFDLEKQLAFDIHAELGIQLTSAERERINERQTESLQALLAFGRGLAAADAGDLALAEQSFAEAESLDPSFSAASTRKQEVASTQAVSTVESARQLSSAAQQVSQQKQAVQKMSSAPASIQQIIQNLGPRPRSVLAEVLGQDRVGQVILLELIFRGPGGRE